MYNQKNIGMAFVIMGTFLFFAIAGEFAIKILFAGLALVCIDYGFRLMGKPPLFVMVQNWFDSLSR